MQSQVHDFIAITEICGTASCTVQYMGGYVFLGKTDLQDEAVELFIVRQQLKCNKLCLGMNENE